MRYTVAPLLLMLVGCATGAPMTLTAGPGTADTHACLVRAAADAGYQVTAHDATAGQVRAEREQSTSRSPLSPGDVDTFLDRIDVTSTTSGTRATVSFVQRTTAGRDVGSERAHAPRPDARADADRILAACL